MKRALESEDGTKERLQVIVPKEQVSEVLKWLHNGTSGGHLGLRKTSEKVRERFFLGKLQELREGLVQKMYRVFFFS